MNWVQKYESEFGMMQPAGVGQYVRLYDYRTLEGESDKLRKKCEIMSEALKFYKNPNQYHGGVALPDCIIRDGGKAARKALAEAEAVG